MFLTLKVIDSQDNIVCTGSGEDFVDLVCKHTYQEGDRIELTSSEEGCYKIGRASCRERVFYSV